MAHELNEKYLEDYGWVKDNDDRWVPMELQGIANTISFEAAMSFMKALENVDLNDDVLEDTK